MLDSQNPASSAPQTDPKQIDDILQKSFDARVRDIAESVNLARQAMDLSGQIGYDKGVAYAHCYLGFFYMIKSEHQLALEHSEHCQPYFESANDRSGLALALYTIGSVHYKTNDYHFALKHVLQCYELYQADNNLLGQSRALKVIGTLYEFFGEYDKAEETYLRCVEISEKINDKNGMSNAYNPLSGIYLRKNEHSKALETINASIELKEASGDKRGLAFALYGKAKVHLANSEHDKAEELFLDSLDIHDEMGELVGAMMTLNKLGDACYKRKKYKTARVYLNEALAKGEKSNHLLIMYKAYKTLYLVAKKEGKIEEALDHLEKHLSYKEQVVNRETSNVIKSIQSITKVEMLAKEAKWQKEKKEELERKNTELDAFVYKVSHDLRGPISSLMGLFNIVELEIDNKEALDYFKLYNQHIHRLNNILMDFINLIQIKEKKLEAVPINFENMVQECIDSYKFSPHFEQISFEVNIQGKGQFITDKSTIHTIIQNLIENAIKYARIDAQPFVQIEINQSKAKSMLTIEVSDNGIGIEENDYNKIFDMFFRGTHAVPGTGLGLYLLKCAVDKLAGKLSFTSKVNVGSSFVIQIPLLQSS